MARHPSARSWRARPLCVSLRTRSTAEIPGLLALDPEGPRRLPALLRPLRGRARGASSTATWSARRPRAHHDQELPGGHPPLSASTGRSATTLLITGALDFVVKPLAPLFDEIIAAEMSILRADGTYSGESTPAPLMETVKILADYCAAEGLELAKSVAYADSTSDLDWRRSGSPSPSTRRRGWPPSPQAGWLVEQWSKAPGGPRPILPIGPLLSARQRRAQSPDGCVRAGAMKGLRIERKMARFAAARVAGSVAPGAGATYGPLSLDDVDPPDLPGREWVYLRPPAGLRERPLDRGRHGQPLLRAHRGLPRSPPGMRSWPTPTTTAVSFSRCSAAWPGASTRPARPAPVGPRPRRLRAAGLRAPRGRAADRRPLRHRWRLEHDDGRPPQPGRRRAGTAHGDQAGHGRTDRLRGPRRATSSSGRAIVVVLGAGTLWPARRSPGRPDPLAGAIITSARYPHQMRLAVARRRPGLRSPAPCPASSAA